MVLCLLPISSSYALPLDLNKLHVPKGFEVSVYASELDTPRQMALGENGVVFVGTLHDKVYALEPQDDLTSAKKINVIAKDLNSPNGVAFHDGALYVAEIEKISRYDAILSHLGMATKDIKKTTTIFNHSLPDKSWHGNRYIKFGPDNWLYVSIGMPCNTCLEEDPRFGTISRISLENPEKLDIYAHGLRNSMGFAWDPADNVLWITDNGQDMMGDDLPPDELNRAPKPNMNFGFPFFYGDNAPSPQFRYHPLAIAEDMTVPVLNLPAHVAALGMTFYTGNSFPAAKYKDSIFVALHGSWNRSKKDGYEVIRVDHNKDGTIERFASFVWGWLDNESQKAWGRPVDVLVMPDGALLVSDDMNGVIYRIAYKDPEKH